ncbi:cupin domain-containing protein [Mesorhizobium kowhaii]|uniref:cupin domain-containing protein n=1 Tax=Mesorhizobium kowhaii TaxID=1300272 RepID=UPI00142D6D25|nr:cupin domain-containing protein [Mesorhizobium kowhaii]
MKDSRKANAYRVALATGNAVWFIGAYVGILTDSSDTAGKLGLSEWIGPKGMMAPPHSHTFEAEGFYIIEGNVDITVGGQTFNCDRGDFVYVPKTVPHEFLVKSATAKFLVTITPAGFEEFFRDLSEGPAKAPTWPFDGGQGVPPLERVIDVGRKFGWKQEAEPRELSAAIRARIFSAPAYTGPAFGLNGALIQFKATREQTEDRFSVSEWQAPGGWVLPNARYDGQSTTFYGLDGRFVVTLEDGSRLAVAAGDLVHVPAGVLHSVSAETVLARVLVIANDSVVEDAVKRGTELNRPFDALFGQRSSNAAVVGDEGWANG